MGFMDKLKELTGKGKDVADQHGDKIADGVDQATDVVDDKTEGKMSDHLDKVDDTADNLRDSDSDDEGAEV